MKTLKKLWLWVAAAMSLAITICVIMFRNDQKERVQEVATRRKIEKERVNAVDAQAAAEVKDAKRTGGLADHLRRDGAGK